MPGINKRNALQQAEMEQVVYNWLIQGYSNKKIIEELKLKYDYKQPNAEKIISKIIKELTVVEINEVNELKTKYLNMFLDLYNRAVEIDDTRSGNDILKSIIKLQGLDIIKIESKNETNVNVDLTNVTDDKLDELINRLSNKNE